MGSKWEKIKLKEVVDIITTKVDVSQISLCDYISTENMLTNFGGISIANSKPSTGKITKFHSGDILFSNIRTYFKKLWLADRTGGCSNDVIVFRPKKHINSNYILSVLMDQKFIEYTVLTSKGTKMPRGDKTAILDYEFNLAPDKYCQHIAKTNTLIFSKLKSNEVINKSLEQMSQTLFKSWFVDFDPVIYNALDAGNPIPEALQSRAELRQKVRNSTDFKPLPAEIRSLFPSEFEETELGWVPKGWSIVRTEDIALKIGMGPFGSNIKVSTFVNAGVPIISGQHLKALLLIDGDNNFITPEHAEKLKNSAVYRKDIIFTHAGNIGQVSLIPEDSEYDRYIISQRQFFLRVNESKSSPYYLIHYFRSEKGQHDLLSNASQVGVPSIAQPSTHLKNISFLNPPMVLLKEFEKFSTPLFHRFSKNRKCGVSLTALRNTLLPKLISGELSLEDLPDLSTDTEAA